MAAIKRGGTQGKRGQHKAFEAAVRRAQETVAAGGTRLVKVSAGEALYLWVTPDRRPAWRLKYRVKVDGRLVERTLSLGTWPEVVRERALEAAREARVVVRAGMDPVTQRRAAVAETLEAQAERFEDLAGQWLNRMRPGWSAVHYEKSRRALERDILPTLGPLPVADIKPVMVAKVLGEVEKRGAVETASRIRQHIAAIFDLGRALGLRDDNPVVRVGFSRATGNTKGRQPALLTPPELGAVLRAAEIAHLSPSVRLASWLLAHTVPRAGELVPAEWSELDLDSDDPRWTIPRARMKRQGTDRDPAIPLAPQVVARLREWRQLTGGHGYVFPSFARSGTHTTIESLEKAYRVTLGLRGRHVPHGWRSAFSTLAHDALDAKGKRRFEADVIEIALDHVHGTEVRVAYDRGERWQARRALMAWWASELEAAVRGADVVSLLAERRVSGG